MQKAEKFCTYFLVTVFGMIATYLTYTSMVSTAYIYNWEDTLFIDDNVFLNIAAVVLVIALCCFFKHINITISDSFVKIYIITVNLFMVWFVLSTQFVSVDDQKQVLATASAFLNGNYEPWNEGGYCFRWGHQNGIVLVYAFLSMIFGEGNYPAFQLLNIAFVAVTYYFIYQSFKKLLPSNNLTKLILMALYTFLPYLMYVTYIYGTLIGMMFVSAGIYFVICFLDETDIKNGLAAAVLLACATVCKSNFFIHIIAVCILLVVDIFRNGKKDLRNHGIKKLLLIGAIIISCMLSRMATTAVIEQHIGKEAPEGAPAILYVVMGIQEGWKAPGWCNSFNDWLYIDCGYDQDLTNKTGFLWFQKEMSKFDNKHYAVEFFNQKLASIWANPTYECFEILKSRQANTGVPDILVSAMDVGGRFNTVLIKLMDICQMVLYFGVILYCIIRIRKIDFRELIFALVFVGIFLFHILWEARCHYTVPAVVFLIPYSIIGYESCADAVMKIKERNGKRIYGINIWMFFVITFVTVISAVMITYAIPQEKETYEAFLSQYTHSTRIENGTYHIASFMDENMVLGLNKTEDGTELFIEPVSDEESQCFKIQYNFVENGLDFYYIFSNVNDRMLYLREESQMYYGKIYTHNYSMENKNLWKITENGDGTYYIENFYGMALTYDIDTGEVLLTPFSGEDNQKWQLKEK